MFKLTHVRVPALFSAAVLCAAVTTAAPIVIVTGDVTLVPTPIALSYPDSPVSAPTAILFNEYLNAVMPTFSGFDPLLVGLDFYPLQISTPGTYPPDTEAGGQIASGSEFSSYILHFDWLPESRAVGTIEFDQPILGLQTFGAFPLREMLFQTAGVNLIGSTGVELCNSDPLTCDLLVLSADRLTLSFDLRINGATDDVRIFVTADAAPVPEPATLALMAVGVSLVAWRRRATRRTGSPGRRRSRSGARQRPVCP